MFKDKANEHEQKHVVCFRHYSECLFHRNFMRYMSGISPFCRRGNWNTDKLNNSSQLVNNISETQMQVV